MSGSIVENGITILPRVVGNLEPIPFTLLDNTGAVVNLTGKTLTMRLVLIEDGSVKLSAGACTISSASTGVGYYQPVTIDMDTAGDYAIWIIDTSVTPNRRYPFEPISENGTHPYVLSIRNEDGTQ